jgi:hypothetical protein
MSRIKIMIYVNTAIYIDIRKSLVQTILLYVGLPCVLINFSPLFFMPF